MRELRDMTEKELAVMFFKYDEDSGTLWINCNAMVDWCGDKPEAQILKQSFEHLLIHTAATLTNNEPVSS